MLLKNLIRYISKDKKNIIISGISTDSKKIKRNYIFFAIRGKKFNGEKFIKEAVYNAINRKPKGHDFIIDRRSGTKSVARHMNVTGG